MDELVVMRRKESVRGLLARQRGGNLQLLDPRPLVHVRAVYGRAIAITDTHVLHEWVRYGEYHVRWDERWQVQPVTQDNWFGEPLD